jgi:hypothetical protein
MNDAPHVHIPIEVILNQPLGLGTLDSPTLGHLGFDGGPFQIGIRRRIPLAISPHFIILWEQVLGFESRVALEVCATKDMLWTQLVRLETRHASGACHCTSYAVVGVGEGLDMGGGLDGNSLDQ